MAEKPSGGGFRLDLGEPLASQLTQLCQRNFRSKTQVIREALTMYLKSLEKPEKEEEHE
jgi:hypothetical protein